MNKDFRIAVGLPTHFKAKKLMRELGDRSFYNLVRLWAFVAMYRPRGILENMTPGDIEDAAGWHGPLGKFVDTLAQEGIGFLDLENGVYQIHDWIEHNKYAFYSPERSERASNAAKKRQEKRGGIIHNSPTCETSAKADVGHGKVSAKTPPKGEREREREGEGERDINITPKREECEKGDPIGDEFKDVWNPMAGTCGVPKVMKMTKARIEKLKTRRKEVFFRENWRGAIGMIPESDHLCCRNSDNRDSRYRNWKANPDWFLSNDTVVVKIMEGKFRNEDGNDGGNGEDPGPVSLEEIIAQKKMDLEKAGG